MSSLTAVVTRSTAPTAKPSWKQTAAPAFIRLPSGTRINRALIALHRVRSQWQESRTARINAMRGLLHEFRISAIAGSKRFMNDVPQLLSKQHLLGGVHIRSLYSAHPF